MKRKTNGFALIPFLLVIGLIGAIGYLVWQTVNSHPTARDQTISWQDAIEMIEGCKIEQVVQLHSREIRLTHTNGSELTTIEPNIDDVFDVVQSVENTCGNIIVATE